MSEVFSQVFKSTFLIPNKVNGTGMDTNGIQILVADDNTLNHRVLELTLKGNGFGLNFTENGKAALELCRDNEYHLILMDLNMPVMDGLEACRRIRELSAFNQTPIVAMSGNSCERSKVDSFEAGMDDFIVKPFSKEDLFKTIDKWLAAGVDSF